MRTKRIKRTKPRQAMSARQVDRVEREVVAIIGLLEGLVVRDPWVRHFLRTAVARLNRLLASVKRSERR